MSARLPFRWLATSRSSVLKWCGSPSEQRPYALREAIRIAHFTFPHLDNAPSESLQRSLVSPIPANVAIELGRPELGSSLRDGGKPAVVPMPEAAMHEDDRSMLPEDKIGSPGKRFAVQPEAKAEPMYQRAHDELWLSVLATYAGHHPGAHLGRDDVHSMRPASVSGGALYTFH